MSLEDERVEAARVERRRAHEEFVSDDAERPQVHPGARRVLYSQLGMHSMVLGGCHDPGSRYLEEPGWHNQAGPQHSEAQALGPPRSGLHEASRSRPPVRRGEPGSCIQKALRVFRTP